MKELICLFKGHKTIPDDIKSLFIHRLCRLKGYDLNHPKISDKEFLYLGTRDSSLTREFAYKMEDCINTCVRCKKVIPPQNKLKND